MFGPIRYVDVEEKSAPTQKIQAQKGLRGAKLRRATDLVEFVGCGCDVQLKQQLRQHVEKLLTAGSCGKQPQTQRPVRATAAFTRIY